MAHWALPKERQLRLWSKPSQCAWEDWVPVAPKGWALAAFWASWAGVFSDDRSEVAFSRRPHHGENGCTQPKGCHREFKFAVEYPDRKGFISRPGWNEGRSTLTHTCDCKAGQVATRLTVPCVFFQFGREPWVRGDHGAWQGVCRGPSICSEHPQDLNSPCQGSSAPWFWSD